MDELRVRLYVLLEIVKGMQEIFDGLVGRTTTYEQYGFLAVRIKGFYERAGFAVENTQVEY